MISSMSEIITSAPADHELRSTQEYALKIPEGFPIPKPVQINAELFRNWRRSVVELEYAHPVWKKVWECVADHITLITFEDFTAQLAKQIQYISQFVRSHDIEMTYVIVPDSTDHWGKRKPTPSEYWVAALVKENAPFPICVIEDAQFGHHESDKNFAANAMSTLLLYVDDCAYTGTQAGQQMGRISGRRRYAFQEKVMIPFMSLGGRDALLQLSGFDADVIAPFKRILQFKDFIPHYFSSGELEMAQQMLEDVFYSGEVPVATQTLTLFAHKMPDFISFPEQIADGNIAWSTGPGHYHHGRHEQSYPFIPRIVPPYRGWTPDWVTDEDE